MNENENEVMWEGRLTALIACTGLVILFVAFALILVLVLKNLFKKSTIEAEAAPLRISFEEQVKHDLDYKYEVYLWEQRQKEKAKKEEETVNYRIEITEEERDLMARVVMSEASVLNGDGKIAVASVIVNRALAKGFPDTVKEVIEQPNQFSTADNGEPTEECYLAVESALLFEAYPWDMFWFRTDYPHSWGYEYTRIGNTVFSTKGDYREN